MSPFPTLSNLVRFSEDAAGIEKTLRVFQGFCTTLAGLAHSAESASPWRQARSQLALGSFPYRYLHSEDSAYREVGRRYFRFFKWHGCWRRAYAASNSAEASFVLKALEVARWSFLGFYGRRCLKLLFRCLTSTDAHQYVPAEGC